YPFLFLLRGRRLPTQLLALAGILLGTPLAFGLYPAADLDLRGRVPDDVWVRDFEPQLDGWFAHWGKNTNLATAFDVWFLNLFPRETPFVSEPGGYATLNFVPSLATMLLGLCAGEMLHRERSVGRQLLWLVGAGLLCLGGGWLMAQTLCPLVKR